MRSCHVLQLPGGPFRQSRVGAPALRTLKTGKEGGVNQRNEQPAPASQRLLVGQLIFSDMNGSSGRGGGGGNQQGVLGTKPEEYRSPSSDTRDGSVRFSRSLLKSSKSDHVAAPWSKNALCEYMPSVAWVCFRSAPLIDLIKRSIPHIHRETTKL